MPEVYFSVQNRVWSIVILVILCITGACSKNNPDNRYDRLSNNNQAWQDATDVINGGSNQGGSLRRFSFLRSGVFAINCEASDASCVTGGNTTGSWDYITNTKIQVTIYNGPILFYDIIQISPTSLWLQDNNTRGKQIIRKFIPAI